jgi:hypothetical protein
MFLRTVKDLDFKRLLFMMNFVKTSVHRSFSFRKSGKNELYLIDNQW